MNAEPDREKSVVPDGELPPEKKRGWREYAIECNRLYVVGCLVMICGVLLWLGHLTTLLPTFRGSGFVVIILGCALWHLGILCPRRRKL